MKKILTAILILAFASPALACDTLLAKYDQAKTVDFCLYITDATTGAVKVENAVHASGDTYLMKDEGAEANTTNAFVDEGSCYSIALTATEMQAARVTLNIEDQGTKAWADKCVVIETYGNASAEHAFDLDTATQSVSVGSGGITTASFASGAIDATAIAADAIGASELATAAIGAAEIATDAITSAEVADDALTRTKFAADGTAQATNSDTTHVQLAASEAYPDSSLVGRSVCIVSGTGIGQCREITANALTNDIVTVSPSWTAPDATSKYVISGRTKLTAIEAGAITASSIASDAITDAKVANDLTLSNVSGGGSVSNTVLTDYVEILNTSFTSVVSSQAQTAYLLPKFFVPVEVELSADHQSGTTPTLDVVIEHSLDNSNWSTLKTFTQVTTTDGYERLTLTTSVGRYVRAKVTTGGTSPNYNPVVVKFWGNTNAASK